MTRILVCFKITRDVEHITPAELIALRDGQQDISQFRKKLGSYDEAALETALRLREALGAETILHAVTVGECESRFIKDLYAVGYDCVCALPCQEDLTYHPETVAALLAQYAGKQGDYDMILTGKQAGLGENAFTPYLLAKKLGLPCVSQVLSILPCEGGPIVRTQTDTGYAQRKVTRPAVYAIGEVAHPYLRVPSLRESLAAAKKPAETFLPTAERKSDSLRFMGYHFTEVIKQCREIPGENMEEKVSALLDIYREELGL